MNLIYTYIFKHYFVLLLGFIFYFFILMFVLKKLNTIAIFHKIFATKSFILGCACGAMVAIVIFMFNTELNILAFKTFLIAFISGGGTQIYATLYSFYKSNANESFGVCVCIIVFTISTLLNTAIMLDIICCSPLSLLMAYNF